MHETQKSRTYFAKFREKIFASFVSRAEHECHGLLPHLSMSYFPLRGRFLRITHPSATLVQSTRITNTTNQQILPIIILQFFHSAFFIDWVICLLGYLLILVLRTSVRLACLRHAASVHPEPGSNSHKKNSYHFPTEEL